MLYASGIRGLFLFLALVVGCGGESPIEPDPGDLVTTPPPEPLTGVVIASDSIVVPAQVNDFTIQPFSVGGDLLADIGPAEGKFLVLSVRDLTRPELVCSGGSFSTPCVTIIVLPELRSSVSVDLESGRHKWHLQSNYTLGDEPEPG